MTTGMVFRIERFGVHDGPGIRTVVFLKGCPLRCLWCSTPESQVFSPQMAYDANKCIGCAACLRTCPEEALTLSPTGEVITDRRRCTNCGLCARECPTQARILIGQEMEALAVVGEIEKDAFFYRNSDGGVTLSGGEPAFQAKFCAEILTACQARGIHTAIETCGDAAWNRLDLLLKHLDLVFFDLKVLSSEKHLRITGRRNERILANLDRIVKDYAGIPLIVRIPIIPGYNDSVENMAQVTDFVRQLGGVDRIELLPYHPLGVGGYKVLDREYLLQNISVPAIDHLLELQEVLRLSGIAVKIGG